MRPIFDATPPFHASLLFSFIFIRLASTDSSLCTQIDAAFSSTPDDFEMASFIIDNSGPPGLQGLQSATNAPKRRVCNCFTDSSVSAREVRSYRNTDTIWLGCTRQTMPQVFKALSALNETMVSKLWIWDSIINIIPADMFAKVRPRVLSIESSHLGIFRKGAFSKIGQRLKVLQLRNNILLKIEPMIFEDITRLEELDLGGNKIAEIKTGQLDNLKNLEVLILNDNQLSRIEDGAFQSLVNLKTLNLASNKLTNITKDTFRGLNNLESLSLQGNQIANVDWTAFAHMKNLKSLDIGNNKITHVELRGLESLEKLFINNNSIDSMKNVSLRDLRSLNILNLDRNSITVVSDGDLHSLGESARLASFSIAGNKITKIETRALEPIHQITVLSLQNNQLKAVSGTDEGGASFLRPLRKLVRLYLSENILTHIDENDFTSLTSLRVLALDHNKIEKIHSRALSRMSLKRLYLNNNNLHYLAKGTFDSLSMDSLYAIDVSENNWQCICGEEWLADWLAAAGASNISDGNMGCVAARICGGKITEEEQHSVWITVIASILAIVSLLILVAIGFLYLEDGKRMEKLSHPLRRVPSDLLQLIPNSGSSLSLPRDTGVEPLISGDLLFKQSSLTSSLRNGGAKTNPVIIHQPNSDNTQSAATPAAAAAADKKRVRFNGV